MHRVCNLSLFELLHYSSWNIFNAFQSYIPRPNRFGIISRPQRWRQRLTCSESLHKFRARGRRNVDHDRCLVGSDCRLVFFSTSTQFHTHFFNVFHVFNCIHDYSISFNIIHVFFTSCQHIMLKKQNTSAAETNGANTFRKHSVPNPLALVSLRSAWDKNQASHWLLWSWSGRDHPTIKSFEMRNNTATHGIGWKKFTKQSWNWEGSQCWQCSSPCLTINPCSAASTDWRQGHASLEHQ